MPPALARSHEDLAPAPLRPPEEPARALIRRSAAVADGVPFRGELSRGRASKFADCRTPPRR